MQIIIKKTIRADAIQDLCRRLEAATGLKFMADKETDTLNGSVTSMYDGTAEDTVIVEVYENDKAPCKEHKSTFKKTILTDSIRTKIETEVLK